MLHAYIMLNDHACIYIIFPGPCLSMSVAPWSNFYMTAVFRRLGSHIGLIYNLNMHAFVSEAMIEIVNFLVPVVFISCMHA